MTKSSSKIFVGVICLQLLLGIEVKAQALQEKHVFNDEFTQDFFIEDFSGRLIGTTVYLKFLIKEKTSSINYILESSVDGIDFTPIYLKEGFISPMNEPLLYCYKATINVGDISYYRIKRAVNNEVFYSAILRFENYNRAELSALNN
jgi:hypothetical protein